MINKGVTLGILNRYEEEIAIYDEVVRRFGESPLLGLQEQVARALLYKGWCGGLASRRRPRCRKSSPAHAQ